MINVNTLSTYTPATRTAAVDELKKISGDSQANSRHAQADSVTLSSAAIAAAQGKTVEAEPIDRYQALASNQRVADTRQAMAPAKVGREDFMKTALQGTLDQRLGLDREKLQALEAKMKQVAENENLTTEQKAEQLATLQEQMDELTREATQSALRQEQTAKIEKELAQITDKL